MRTVIGAIVVALAGATAQPAFAGEGAAPAGAAPLLTVSAAAAPMLGVVSSLGDLPGATTPQTGFRVAPLTLVAAAPSSSVPTTDLAGGLRRRFTGSMMEFYPFAGSGFHLSGGARLFQRRNFLAETADSARGALAVTRVTMQSAVTRAGFRRFNPVATLGYTAPLTQMMQIGVEAGAMAGRAFAGTPGLSRGGFGYRSDNAFHPDAIANLVFGMHF